MSKRGDGTCLMTFFKNIWDYIVVIGGVAAIYHVFVYPDASVSNALSLIAGILGWVYLAKGIVLFFANRVKFDWHLVNGNYILKVVALVLLIPFSLSMVISQDKKIETKDLVYESHLYVQQTDSLETDNADSVKAVTANKQEDPPLLWGVYYHFIDAGNQHMTTSKDGRLWAVLISIIGVFLLNGLLVSSIVGAVDTRKSKWVKGEIRYSWLMGLRGHYVVIGANDVAQGIIRQLLQRDKGIFSPMVLVLTSSDVESLRRELFTELTESQQKRVVIYYGSCTSSADIRALRLRAAKEVYVLGEVSGTDDKDSYHDVMNMECLKLISSEISDVAKFCKNEKEDNRLVCRVMFEYQSTFNVFQVTDIDVQKIKFLPFNYYEKWAQNVLVCQELSDEESDYRSLPLEGINGIKYDDPHHVHLVVIGMSRMGIAMAIEAAHLAHYPNFEEKHIKTKITLIDKNAAEEKNFFMGRFKALFALSDWKYGDASGDTLKWIKEEKACAPEHLGGDFVDLEWEFLSGSAEDAAVRQYLSDVAEDKNAKLTVAVCLPENSRAVAAAAYLPDKVYESDSTLQVLVYQRLNAEMIRQIGENNNRYHNKMKAFGMSLGCYDSDLVELCECLGREIGKAYGEWKSKNVHPEVMSSGKSKSAKMWSNQYNIYSMWTKFRCVTTSDGKVFNPLVRDFADFENEEMKTRLALTEHNRWVAEQLLLRYRPLTEDEQDAAKSLDEKNRLKEYCFAHLDICSNEKLKTIDHLIPSLDTALVAVLPQAYKDYMYNEKGLHTAADGRK